MQACVLRLIGGARRAVGVDGKFTGGDKRRLAVTRLGLIASPTTPCGPARCCLGCVEARVSERQITNIATRPLRLTPGGKPRRRGVAVKSRDIVPLAGQSLCGGAGKFSCQKNLPALPSSDSWAGIFSWQEDFETWPALPQTPTPAPLAVPPWGPTGFSSFFALVRVAASNRH